MDNALNCIHRIVRIEINGRGPIQRGAASALITLLMGVAASSAQAADVLLVGSGGAGGGDGTDGYINGGNGGADFFLPGAGGAAGVPLPTQTIPGTADGSSLLPSYEYVGIGGGGGGGDGGDLGGLNGEVGGAGAINLDGTALNVDNTLFVGGAGGGGGSGGAGSTRGGTGGAGGAGTLTATGGATITVGTQLYIGGLPGAGGNCGCSGYGGAGGAGVFNLGDGSTLNLTGAAFTINGAGTLNIGSATANEASAGTITGLAGSIDNAGAINFNQSDALYTFSTAISGSGTVTQNGSGTTVLTGANTYSGGTYVNAGMINFSNAGNLGLGKITLDGGGLQWAAGNTADISGKLIVLGASGGKLDTNGNDVTLATGIGGLGGLTKTGAGTLTLTDISTYTGATTIDQGTLALAGTGALASATSVALTSAATVFDMSAGGNQSLAHLSGVAGSQVALGANTLTLTDNTSQIFSGSLTGSGGLVKLGSGVLTLNGASGSFTGTTTIAGGTLAVGDEAHAGAVLGGSVLVDPLGTLIGHGTVLGDLTNGGVVAPGGSIGTLTVGGNYSQSNNGTLAIEVSPTTASRLRVGGSAALDGTLAVMFAPGTYSARQYTLLSAANGVTGRFANVDMTTAGANLGKLQSSITYGANNVGLTLADDSLVVAPVNTSIYTALTTTAVLQAQGANASLFERLANVQRGVETSRNAWVRFTGARNKVDGTGDEPGFQAHTYGFLAGVDRQFGSATVGVAGGYSHTSISEDDTGASGDIDTLRLALYASQPVGRVNLSATMGYGLDFLSQKRPFGGFGTAEGDHTGHEFTAATQASVPMQVGGFVLTPHAGLRYAYVRANGFSESGAHGQDLDVDSDDVHSLQPYVGMTLDKQFGDAQRPMNLQFRLGYAHEVLSSGRATAVQSQDGTVFTAKGTDLPRSFLTTGASIRLMASKSTTVALGADAIINTGHASAQTAYIRLNHRF